MDREVYDRARVEEPMQTAELMPSIVSHPLRL